MEKEIDELLKRLRFVKEDLGLDIPEGETQESNEKGFQLIQSRIINQISAVKALIQQRNELSERGANRRKVIEKNSQIFKKLKDISEDYVKLKERYEKDKKKLVRKPTEEEMKERIEALSTIQKQIKQVQEMSEEGQKALSLDTTIGFSDNMSFEVVEDKEEKRDERGELMGTGTVHVDLGGSGGPDLSDTQQQALVQIEQNQQEVDQMLEMISLGIDDLQGMAEGMNDEIKKQNKMVDELDASVDRTQQNLDDVRGRLKTNLAKARGGDKFCMDMILLFCIVVVGMIIIKIIT